MRVFNTKTCPDILPHPFVAERALDRLVTPNRSIWDMASEDHLQEPKIPRRRVSIASDPVYEARLSPQATEPRRRISVATEFANDSSIRRKSALLYPTILTELTSPDGRRKSILQNNQEDMSLNTNHSLLSTDIEGRRKSILQNKSPDTLSLYSHHSNPYIQENGKPINGEFGPPKKYSMTTDSLPDRIKYPEESQERPWWFVLCKKCRQPESGIPSWEPPLWQRLCPPPFCPSYRQFARVLALFLVGLLSWGVVYSVLGRTAAPGGQLFGLAMLCIAAHFGGWLFTLVNLPALVGMLVVGILFQNVGLVHIEGEYIEVVVVLRRIALVIILTRAGLDLDPPALRKLWVTVLKLGLVPWIIECVVVAVISHYLLGLPWFWGLLLGGRPLHVPSESILSLADVLSMLFMNVRRLLLVSSIISAVSPAVVVPCLFRLRTKGYGVSKGIPTLIIAVSGIDDATSVAVFGIVHSLMFTEESLTYEILQGPLSIAGGIAFGIVWGVLSKYVPEKNDPYVVPLRILMLLGGGLISVLGSECLGFGGAGPLGCVSAAFVSLLCWSQQGWEIEDNPVATAFEIFWMLFEPVLFGLTGTQIKINELEAHTVMLCFACLVSGILIRVVATVFVAIGSQLNLKEKIFVALSWMSKASVQAALGPVALNSVRSGSDEQKGYAEMVLMMCVLSILLTAPTGAILISLSGSRLLKKTLSPPIVEGWRRSARPSLRDITIIDEEEDGEGVAS
uniref:Cation/H+ exchanger transmembrane domain-containing protein n=2 Tax=Timema TaxID=61471 RepID=A0A7R9PGS7_TIMGE|nr:unnamed protein product [Timema genevievae]